MKEYSEKVILTKFPIIKKERRCEISGLTTHLNIPQYEVKLKLSKQKWVVEKREKSMKPKLVLCKYQQNP